MHHNNHEEFLGIDVGDIRIGIARGSSLARIAEPLKTVLSATAFAEIGTLANHYQIAGIVVGLPRSLEGAETTQTKKVRNWVKQAQAQLDYPFYWQDEALTSREATGKFQTSNFKHQIFDDHNLAAAIILQDFLNTPAEDRLRA